MHSFGLNIDGNKAGDLGGCKSLKEREVMFSKAMFGKALYFCGALLPLLILGFFVGKSTVNVPHWDEWEFIIPVFQKIYAGDPIGFQMLWADSGDHVILVPRALILILGKLSNINFSVFHWGNVFIAGLTFLFIVKALTQEDQFSKKSKIFMIFIFSIIQFSLEPVGVYLWGISLYIFLTLFWFAWGALILSRPSIKFLGLVTIFLTNAGALLTSANGLALVVLALAVSLLKWYETRRTYWWIAGVVSLVQLILMIALLSQRTLGYDINLFGNGVLPFLKYIFVYLGSNFDLNNVDQAMWYGIGMFGIFGIYCGLVCKSILRGGIRRLTVPEQFFFFLGLLSVATAVLTAIGREGSSGVRQALSDRYILFAHFLLLSVAYSLARVALPSLHARIGSNRTLFPVLGYSRIVAFVFFVALLFDSIAKSYNLSNINTFKRFYDERQLARLSLVKAPHLDVSARAAVEAIYPGGYEPIESRVLFLKSTHSGPFSETRE